jgi:hypothetical protein
LSIVLYGRCKSELEQLVGEFTGIFTNADGNLFFETYNQLNAYFATVPGNYALNLRRLYLLNSNYADLSFLFTILPGEKTNAHLGSEYLAALETDNSTPYFLNLHNGEVAHTLNRLVEPLRDRNAVADCDGVVSYQDILHHEPYYSLALNDAYPRPNRAHFTCI